MAGKFGEAMGSQDGENGDERVIAEMHKIAGEDAAGPRTHQGKDDSDHDEDRD